MGREMESVARLEIDREMTAPTPIIPTFAVPSGPTQDEAKPRNDAGTTYLTIANIILGRYLQKRFRWKCRLIRWAVNGR